MDVGLPYALMGASPSYTCMDEGLSYGRAYIQRQSAPVVSIRPACYVIRSFLQFFRSFVGPLRDGLAIYVAAVFPDVITEVIVDVIAFFSLSSLLHPPHCSLR